jgi:hypothetical protein
VAYNEVCCTECSPRAFSTLHKLNLPAKIGNTGQTVRIKAYVFFLVSSYYNLDHVHNTIKSSSMNHLLFMEEHIAEVCPLVQFNCQAPVYVTINQASSSTRYIQWYLAKMPVKLALKQYAWIRFIKNIITC